MVWRHSHGYLVVGHRYEHRRVMEEKMGRPLRKGEVVHHINGIRDDNRPENLEIASSHGEHMRALHGASVWTAQHQLRLRHLWLKGWPSPEIAVALGRSRHGVENQVAELKREGLLPQIKPRRTRATCKYGHSWTPENIYVYQGRHSCRACHNAVTRAARTNASRA